MKFAEITSLNRSKRGVLTFFRSCGVPDSMTAALRERVDENHPSRLVLEQQSFAIASSGECSTRCNSGSVRSQFRLAKLGLLGQFGADSKVDSNIIAHPAATAFHHD